jgi:L-malate glycosyltransferase
VPASSESGRYLRLVSPREKEESDESRPHILLAVDQLSKTLGGGERMLLRIAHLLPEYGYRVSILALGVDSDSPVFNDPLPCPVYELLVGKTFAPGALRHALQLRRFLRSERIALVQTFFESSDLWVGGVAKLTSGTKLIWSRRDMGILRSRKHEIAYRMMARLPDAVFAVSEQVRRHCIDVDQIPAERVEAIYNGIDLAQWGDTSQRTGLFSAPVIATVGNIRRVKGHDVFVRAAAAIASEFPSASFVIAGEVLEKEYYAELKQLISQLDLEGKVHFAGGINDLAKFLREVDLFVLPSRSEGFSNAIVEAMAAGLPVVATDVGGNAEAVVDGITGRIVPPSDAEELADAIREILRNPQHAQTMGISARRRVAERFTTEAMMKKITTAYRRVLKQA